LTKHFDVKVSHTQLPMPTVWQEAAVPPLQGVEVQVLIVAFQLHRRSELHAETLQPVMHWVRWQTP
jgi:hypothetical protein